MKKNTKKILGILLTLALIVSIVPMFTVAVSAETADYTIVLKDGRAYKNSAEDGEDITSDMSAIGLNCVEDEWKMTGFNFTTTAGNALKLMDKETTILVSGTNSIQNGANARDGIVLGSNVTDSTITIKGVSYIGSAKNTLTLTAQNSDDAVSSVYAIFVEKGSLVIESNVTVTAIAECAQSSSAVIVDELLTVSGTGKLIAKVDENAVYKYAVEVFGAEPDAVATNNADDSTPEWNDYDCTYKNGDDVALDLTLVAAGVSEPEITAGAKQTIDVSKVDTAIFESSVPVNQLMKVVVDGTDVNYKYYTFDVGTVNTVITLNKDFLSGLENGEHTISIVSTSGSADSTFTVIGQTDELSPKTGDNTNIAIWIVLCGIMLSTIAYVFVTKSKKEN